MDKEQIPWAVIEEKLKLIGKKPAWLAGQLITGTNTVTNWKNRGGAPVGRAREIAVALNCSTDDLLNPSLSTKHISRLKDESNTSQKSGMIEASTVRATRNVDPLLRHVGDSPNFRRIYVVGKAQGGLPERIWTDGDHLVGAIDEYAELATPDPQAFICPVVGDSMYPRYMPGEYVLVEPNTAPQIGGTVLVRLLTGETMLKRLEHRANGHVRLVSWNDPVQHTFREEEISWMYYVAHAVPPEKIKMRF
jgi:phage repressor protein C with HTH and peptisase S24 domain